MMPHMDMDMKKDAAATSKATGGADHKCFVDTVRGLDEESLPVDAVLHGDNPNSSATPRQDPKPSMVEGPFGGSKPA